VENADSYGVLCDLPGTDIKDLEISVADNVLTIKGEKKKEKKGEDSSVFLEEMTSGRFQRTLSLPLPIDPEKVEAVLKDGVLKIILPKKEEVKPRQVTVKIR
jgi:HSP20 family protein